MRKISSVIFGCLLLVLTLIPINADVLVTSAKASPVRVDTVEFPKGAYEDGQYFADPDLTYTKVTEPDQSNSYLGDFGDPSKKYWISNDIVVTVTNKTKYILKNAKVGLTGATIYPGTSEYLKWDSSQALFKYTYPGRTGGLSIADAAVDSTPVELVKRGIHKELLDLYGFKYSPNDTIMNALVGELKPGESKTVRYRYRIGPDSKGQEGYDPRIDAYSLGAVLPEGTAAGTPVVTQDAVSGDLKIMVPSVNGNYAPGTEVLLPGHEKPFIVDANGAISVPNANLNAESVIGTMRIKEKDKSPVNVATDVVLPAQKATTEKPSKINVTRDANGDATITPVKADGSTYPKGTAITLPGMSQPLVLDDNGSIKISNDQLPDSEVAGDIIITEKDKLPGSIADKTPAKYVPSTGTSTVDVTQNPNTGETVIKPLDKDGKPYVEGTQVTIPGLKDPIVIGKDGTAVVPNANLPKDASKGKVTIQEPGKLPVEGSEIETPAQIAASKGAESVEVTQDPSTGDTVIKPLDKDGKPFVEGTKVSVPGLNEALTLGKDGSVTVPNKDLPKDAIKGNVTVQEAGKLPVEGSAMETPAQLVPSKGTSSVEVTQKPNTGETVIKPLDQDGKPFVEGTQVTVPGVKDPIVIGKDGTAIVPNDNLPKDAIKGNVTVQEPGKLPVTGSEIETPAKLATSKEAQSVEVTQNPETGDTVIKPLDKDGKPFVEGTQLSIPGLKDTLTLGKDGSVTVPNANLPKDAIKGNVMVQEPGQIPAEGTEMETPAQLVPSKGTGSVEVTQKPDTGETVIKPLDQDGKPFVEGTQVIVPGIKDPIVIGKDGTAVVPNANLPKDAAQGKVTIQEPGKLPVEGSEIETPAQLVPSKGTGSVEVTQNPETGETVIKPLDQDGKPFVEGTKVTVPGVAEAVVVGKDGTAVVPNANLPKDAITGKVSIQEPGKLPVEGSEVETPAQLVPSKGAGSVEVVQNPATGETTVKPLDQDGKPYAEGTKVKMPGVAEAVVVGKDGTAVVPNANLPKDATPGKVSIQEAGKLPVEGLEVKTPAQLDVSKGTSTVEVTQNPETGETVIKPLDQDGKPFVEGTQVTVPGLKDPIVIGQDGTAVVPNANLPKDATQGKVTIQEPGKLPVEGSEIETPAQLVPSKGTGSVEVTQNPETGETVIKPLDQDGKPFVEGTKVTVPGVAEAVVVGKDGTAVVPNANLPKDATQGKVTIQEPGKLPVEGSEVETPAQFVPSKGTGSVEVVQNPETGNAVIKPLDADGKPFVEGTKITVPGVVQAVVVGQDGTAVVPNANLPKDAAQGKVTIQEPGKLAVEGSEVETPAQFVPSKGTGSVEITQNPDTGDIVIKPLDKDGKPFEPGTTVTVPGVKDPIVIDKDGTAVVPNENLPKDGVDGKVTIQEPGKLPVEGSEIETPGQLVPSKGTGSVEVTQNPETGETVIKPLDQDGKPFVEGTKVTVPGVAEAVVVGKDGTAVVPNANLPKDATQGKVTVQEPGKLPVEGSDVETPAQFVPSKGAGSVEVVQNPETGETVIKPLDQDGKPFVEGTKVTVPGVAQAVVVGKDGTAVVPNANLPKDTIKGNVTVQEPGKLPVKGAEVETPAQLAPSKGTGSVEITQNPDTGDIVIKPLDKDGKPFEPGTTVTVPGVKDPIVIDKDGTAVVPNENLPKDGVDGKVTIQEPGKLPVEGSEIETPAQLVPSKGTGSVEVTQNPETGETVVRPLDQDGKPFVEGTKVTVPGVAEAVVVGKDGTAVVPNANLPKDATQGKVTVQEPGKLPVEGSEVKTPAQLVPSKGTGSVEITQNPDTGDIVIKPLDKDGKPFEPGTTVTVPGVKDPIVIDKDGTAVVPNENLPKDGVDGKVTIQQPGKLPVEGSEIETPGQLVPSKGTGSIEVTQNPNTGDIVIKPLDKDGKPFEPGTTVTVPGVKDPIIIGKDGTAVVPNANLPKDGVTGKVTIQEPGKLPVEGSEIETPAQLVPSKGTGSVEITQNPDTGDIVIKPLDKDGKPFEPGTTVTVPGVKDPIVIDKDGTAVVPNENLPKDGINGKVTIQEPGKLPVEGSEILTPGKKETTQTPGSIEVTQNPNTGMVTIKPIDVNGNGYKEGTQITLPGFKNPVVIGKDGTATISNDQLPEQGITGDAILLESGKLPSASSKVTIPAKLIDSDADAIIEVKQDPKTGDLHIKLVDKDGKPYPEGTHVVLPGIKNPVILGKDGSAVVANKELPTNGTTGTITIQEPGKLPIDGTQTTIPAQIATTTIPGKVEITQNPDTGSVTIKPIDKNGDKFKPGTVITIPGIDKTFEIGKDGSVVISNKDLPEGGFTGKITIKEPGSLAIDFEVSIPGKIELKDTSTGILPATGVANYGIFGFGFVIVGALMAYASVLKKRLSKNQI